LRAEAYFLALADLPIEQIERGAALALKESKFFPRAAELRELLLGSATDEAELAWMQLLQEVRRVGYYRTPVLPEETLAVVNGLWGSWQTACQTMPGEGQELLNWAKAFKQTYLARHAALTRRALPIDQPRLLIDSDDE
jgi:hypothetical protein